MFKVAFRNVLRNRRRTIVTLILMSLGSMLFSFFRFFSYGVHEDMIWHTVGLDSGFVQIAANGWLENPVIQRALDVDESLLQKLEVPGVTVVSPRIKGHALASSGEISRFISVLAADPQKEKQITTLSTKMIRGDYLSGQNDGNADYYEGIIGYKLANHLELDVGDTLYLIGSQFDGSMGAIPVRIKGVFRAVDPELDTSRVMINLEGGRRLFAPGNPDEGIVRYTSIALGVDDYKKAAGVIRNLTSIFPDPELAEGEEREESNNYDPVVLDWKEMNPGIIQMMLLDEIQNDFFYSFLVMILAFGMLNNVQMSIHERVRELGILLALGTRPGSLHLMILSEVVMILLPSLAIGTGLGMGLAYYFQLNPIVFSGSIGEMYEDMGMITTLRPIVVPGEILIAIASLLIPSMLLALMAARRIFKLKPVEIIATL